MILLSSPAPVLIAAAMVVFLAWRARDSQARKGIILFGAVVIGLLLSLRHIEARRLSALLFLSSIALVFAVYRAAAAGDRERSCRLGIAALLLVFIVLKWPRLQERVYAALHLPAKYLLSLGAWLGASYILFRLLHVLIEARRPDFPRLSFSELFLYVLLPSTLIAGPIDRYPRFQKNEAFRKPTAEDFAEGGRRILVGVVKKFVIADFLGGLPLDLPHAGLSTARMWASLYIFGFQLYFDFAGYSDIAIGSARLVGFSIPENFDVPYLRRNIARFWQSWHITLSQWMRDYVFFPLGRVLRRRAPSLPPAAAVFLCQAVTMVAIGLWHGVNRSFAAWGLWHAAGLFAHWKWTDWRRGKPALDAAPFRAAGIALTFQFVMVGWVFFYGTSFTESLLILAKLAGR